MQVGVAGLGAMGAAIAARLIEAGHQVTVWNRNAAKTQPLAAAGAKVAATPAEVTNACEAVITIVTDAAAIDAIYNGASGLLSGNAKGKLFIEMSTVPPKVQTELVPKVRAKGASLVECPVGGSTTPARQGKLLGLMGADEADAARAKPILEQLCRRVEHCGSVGTGSSMKLAINLPLMVAWQAFGEAFAMAKDAGWPPKRLLDLFTDSNGANNGLKMRADMIVAMMEGRDPGATTFSVANACKDLRTMLDTGKAKGISLPAVEKALAGFEELRSAAPPESDASRLPVYWSNRKK